MTIEALIEKLEVLKEPRNDADKENCAWNNAIKECISVTRQHFAAQRDVFSALKHLIELKKHKEECGADEWYKSKKDLAWQIAYEAIAAMECIQTTPVCEHPADECKQTLEEITEPMCFDHISGRLTQIVREANSAMRAVDELRVKSEQEAQRAKI